MENDYDEALAGSCLTWGIVSLIFAETGLLGLIFAIVGKNKVKAFKATGAMLTGKAKVGSILSTVALILSIIMLVFWAFYFVIIGVAVAGQI